MAVPDFERAAWIGAKWRPIESSRRGFLVAIVAFHAVAAVALLQWPANRVQRLASPPMIATIVPAPVAERPAETPPRIPPKISSPKPRAAAASPPASNDAAPVFAPMAEMPSVPAPHVIAVESAAVVAAAVPSGAPAATPAPIVAARFDAAYLDNAPPPYPSLARHNGEQGLVMLDVHVTAAGLADTVGIRKSSGSTRLDEAARAAVLHWRFVPARQGDTPVTVWVIVPIRFSLNS